jgi:hypothetical protein
MKNKLTQFVMAGLMVAAVSALTLTAEAQEKKSKKDGPLPFNGKVASVDKAANTLKVGERVFSLTAESRITKGGKPATLGDAVPGEEVAGSYKRVGDKLEVISVRFGPRPEGETKDKGKAKAKGKENSPK